MWMIFSVRLSCYNTSDGKILILLILQSFYDNWHLSWHRKLSVLDLSVLLMLYANTRWHWLVDFDGKHICTMTGNEGKVFII